MSFLDKKIEASNGSQWAVSVGTHQAVVIGLVDYGEDQRTSKKNTPYSVQQGEILFAVEDTNPNGNHKVIGSYKMDFTFNDTKLKKWVDAAKWNFGGGSSFSELFKLPCEINVVEKTSKAGKNFKAIDSIAPGTGFKASGKVELPFFYAESEGTVHLIDGAFISEKKATVQPAPGTANTSQLQDAAVAEAEAEAKVEEQDDSMPF